MTATQWLTRALAALLALALLLASVIVIVEVALAAAGQAPGLVDFTQWTTWMSERTWDDPTVRTILVGLLLLGLLLLLLTLRRGKPATLSLRPRTSGVDVQASRKSVERSLVASASRTSGVTSADASVRRRKARIVARAGRNPEPSLAQDVESAVRERLSSLSLAEEPRLDVQIHAKDNR
jgi:hypothetical protein